MANEVQILTWCDIHLQEKDEHVPGTEYVVQIGKGQPVVVDLCPDCVGPLATVTDLLAAYGRKPNTNGVATRKPKAAAAPAPVASGSDVHVCPDCGHASPNRKSLAGHTRAVHELLLSELEGKTKGLTCITCEPHRDFKSLQAVSIHAGRFHLD
jgi:hypothetical protein